jgi:hypothetical protein
MELQKALTPGEALERVLRFYQTYYNIKTEAVEPPFAAEAIFGSHNEQYFLIKKAKVADIDTNETVYFATEESLSKERLLELDAIAWERGTANVQPSSHHRNSDVVLIILTAHAGEDALAQVKKCRHYQSYLWGFHGWSNYRLIVAELSSGRIVHNRTDSEEARKKGNTVNTRDRNSKYRACLHGKIFEFMDRKTVRK